MVETHLQDVLSVRDERELKDDLVFTDLDRTYVGLEPIVAAWREGSVEQARGFLAEHFRRRKKPMWHYDTREGPEKSAGPAVVTFDNPYCDAELAANALNNQFIVKSTGLVVDMGDAMANVSQGDLWAHSANALLYNRHYFLRSLCTCYARTHEERYAEKAIEFVTAWLDQRPFVVSPHIGPEAYHITLQPDQEAMSLGFQMIHWIGLLYCGIANHMSDELLFAVIRRMWFTMVQYRRFDADEYTEGNHHLFERGVAPMVFGTLFPEFVSMHNFLRTGPAVVKRHLARAIGPDGGPNEHSVPYGSGAIGLYGEADGYGRLNGVSVFTEQERAKIDRAYMFCLHGLGPDGRQIPFGDGGTLRSADVVLAQPMAAGLVQAGAEGLGDTCVSRDTQSALPGRDGVFEGTGFVVARDGWDRGGMLLAMAVPQPQVYLHGHQDLLSVLAYVHGTAFLAHPAWECYNLMGTVPWRERIERGRFYNMTSQNCVLVHSRPVRPDHEFVGGFGHPAPRCVLDEQRTADDEFYVRAHHDGCTFARHTREVVLINGKGMLINDTLTALDREDRPAPIYHLQRWHLDYDVCARRRTIPLWFLNSTANMFC